MAVIRRLPGRARPHEEVLRDHQESNASRPMLALAAVGVDAVVGDLAAVRVKPHL